jgi:anti-anti-sigma factor
MSDILEKGTYTFKMPEHFNTETPYKTVSMLQQLPDSKWERIVLDMSDTAFIDSSGIGILVFLYKELTLRSKALVLKRPQRGVYNLLLETGIDRLFDMELSSGVKKADAELNDLHVQLHMEEERAGDVYIISLFGVMNYPAGSLLFKKNIFMTLASSSKILLDCKELAFFDSLSVGSVLMLNRLLQDNGGSMRICCANNVVHNIFVSLGIDSIIQCYDTREAALDGF